PPKVDRIGHVDPAATSIPRRNEPGADEIGEIRNRPVVTRLDVLVFPQTIDGAANLCRVVGNDLDDLAQNVGIGQQAVLVAVHLGHELPQLLGVVLRVAIARAHASPPWPGSGGAAPVTSTPVTTMASGAVKSRYCPVAMQVPPTVVMVGPPTVVNTAPPTATTPSTCAMASNTGLAQNAPP